MILNVNACDNKFRSNQKKKKKTICKSKKKKENKQPLKSVICLGNSYVKQ